MRGVQARCHRTAHASSGCAHIQLEAAGAGSEGEDHSRVRVLLRSCRQPTMMQRRSWAANSMNGAGVRAHHHGLRVAPQHDRSLPAQERARHAPGQRSASTCARRQQTSSSQASRNQGAARRKVVRYRSRCSATAPWWSARAPAARCGKSPARANCECRNNGRNRGQTTALSRSVNLTFMEVRMANISLAWSIVLRL